VPAWPPIPLSELLVEFAGKLEPQDVATLTNHIQGGALRARNKAVAILAFNRPKLSLENIRALVVMRS
jgi:hypothetical protein